MADLVEAIEEEIVDVEAQLDRLLTLIPQARTVEILNQLATTLDLDATEEVRDDDRRALYRKILGYLNSEDFEGIPNRLYLVTTCLHALMNHLGFAPPGPPDLDDVRQQQQIQQQQQQQQQLQQQQAQQQPPQTNTQNSPKEKPSSTDVLDIPPGPNRSRAVANLLERRRVAELNSSFETLRVLVPSYGNEDRSLSKIKTLKYAFTYIQHLMSVLGELNNSTDEVDLDKDVVVRLCRKDPLIQKTRDHMKNNRKIF